MSNFYASINERESCSYFIARFQYILFFWKIYIYFNGFIN